MDSFICGSCSTVFHDVGEFFEHKKICIAASLDEASQTFEMPQPSLVQATVLDADGKSTTFIIINGDKNNRMSLDGRFKEVGAAVSANASQLHNPVTTSQQNIAMEIMSSESARKRGRPRKSERKNPKSSATISETMSFPEQNADGTITCSGCHKLFTKPRQFSSHKCLALSDYIDDGATSLVDCDEAWSSKRDYSVMTSVDQQKLVGDSREISDPLLSSPSAVGKQYQNGGCESAKSLSGSCAERHHKMPVFQSEEDRLLFDRCLEVDIVPLVSGMYTSQAVKPTVTESVGGLTRSSVNLYTCKTCSKVFTSLSHCQLHCLIHTTTRPYHCPWCSYSTNIRGNLYTHARHHSGMMFQCVRCSFVTANRSHLTEHEQTHRSDQRTCELCHRDYKTVKSLINHTRKYHAQTSAGANYLARLQRETHCKKDKLSQYKCVVCNAEFSSSFRRNRHLRTHSSVDSTADVVVCKLCDQNCDRQTYLSSHLLSHQLIYFCTVCSAPFPSSLRLVGHLKVHQSLSSSEPPLSSTDLFWRSIAVSVFLLPKTNSSGISWLTVTADAMFDESMNTHHNNSLDDILQDADCSPVAGFPHSDTEILASIGSSALEYGQEVVECTEQTHTHHTGVDASTSSSCIDRNVCLKMGYKLMSRDVFSRLRQMYGCSECEYCGQLFFVQSDLDTHMNVHAVDRTFTCSQCRHMAHSRDSLVSHVRQVHEKSYICDTCGTALASRSQLWTHRQKAHDAPMQYLCLPCQLTYATIKRLRIHLEMKHRELSREDIRIQLAAMRTRHAKTGRQLPICPYCYRVFRSASSDLRRHIWIHEGIKPFQCHVCQYTCRTRSNLAAHMLRHSADKPFLCNSCGKAYKSRTALRWHERSHVSGRIFKCDKCSYEAVQPSHLRRHLETHQVQKRFACSHCDYSANTVSYLKIHQTRRHPPTSSSTPRVLAQLHSNGSGLECHICHYVFGNASDLKRHLRLRHGIDSSQPAISSTALVNNLSLTTISNLTAAC